MTVASFLSKQRVDSGFTEWAELAGNCCEGNPFYHPALLQPALCHLNAKGQARILEARHNGQLIGLMPVAPQQRHSRYPVRNISNWTHDQCFFGAPLLRKGYETAAWAELLRQLDRARWAGNFLHLKKLDPDGPSAAALRQCCADEKRPYKQIHRFERALLQSDLPAARYWETNIAAKKRKEIRRLINRLAECGSVTHRHFDDKANVGEWARDFLCLEASGWKGKEGTALDSQPETRNYFMQILALAAAENMLDMLRIDVNGEPIAMLVNFLSGHGAYSYKVAFDERFARFSPGVLIEIDNLHYMLGDGATPHRDKPPVIAWMDSCAAPDHPMINGLWAERRSICQYRVALNGAGTTGLTRRAAYTAISLAETAIRSIRKYQ